MISGLLIRTLVVIALIVSVCVNSTMPQQARRANRSRCEELHHRLANRSGDEVNFRKRYSDGDRDFVAFEHSIA